MNEPPRLSTEAVITMQEQRTLVTDVQAGDPDGDTEGDGLTYRLSGGADQLLFSIDPDTGVLSFDETPDFGVPGDADADNFYGVQVTVEDSGGLTHVRNFSVGFLQQDFGDAADSVDSPRYPTLLAHDGARHTVGTLFLGAGVDREVNGQPTANADGDNDDGVQMIASIVAASVATASSVYVTASEAGTLDAWIDFDRDGDWLDNGEQIFTSIDLAMGANLLSFTVPAGAAAGETVARFRLSSTGGLAPTGSAADGEVEDHAITILDGQAAGGVTVDIRPPVSGEMDVLADGNEVVVRTSVELFRAPGMR